MSARALLIVLLLLAGVSRAEAQGWTFGNVNIGYEGYGDFRLVIPSDQKTWFDGGLGKLRYGVSGQDPQIQMSEVFGQVHAQIGGEFLAMVAVRAETPHQDTLLDVTEAFVRYRPVSTSPFRWSVRAGIFFAPISLENTEIGWQSPWTLTWSAINSWVGEELRTLGAEGRMEWRTDTRVLSAYGSVYGWNDPTGILLADRGWAFHDWVTGMQHRPRLPDVFARGRRMPIPSRTFEFVEIDSRAGWYAGATWDEVGLGALEFLYYDNEADPAATRMQTAWRTDFWSVGAHTHWGPFTVLAQGMRGDTFFQPSTTFSANTYFESAYALLGWEAGEWRLAGRFDVFTTTETRSRVTAIYLSEHGHSFTLAANWLPNDWIRLTAEWIQVDSVRRQRTLDRLAAEQIENMFQLSAKLYF